MKRESHAELQARERAELQDWFRTLDGSELTRSELRAMRVALERTRRRQARIDRHRAAVRAARSEP